MLSQNPRFVEKITKNTQTRFYNENLTTDKYTKQLQTTGEDIGKEIGERTRASYGRHQGHLGAFVQ